MLLSVARSFCEAAEVETCAGEPAHAASQQHSKLSGDDFNDRHSWDEVLKPHGWMCDHSKAGEDFWRRPGKKGLGISATSNWRGCDLLYVFSSNAAPFEPQRAYSKFGAYGLLNHAGDFKAAARELASGGYGSTGKKAVAKAVAYAESEEWGEPLPIGEIVPSVEPLVPEMLPNSFRPWLSDVAERMNVPLDYPAAASTVSLSAAVGRRVQVFPKEQDESWCPVSNLWGAGVGLPGTQKTAAINEGMVALFRLEKEALEANEQEKKDHFRRLERFKVEHEAWREKAKKRSKSAQPFEDFCLERPQEPVPRRYITNDATAEKLHELLRDNPAGMLYFRDELSGWLSIMEREDRAMDRGFLLEAWEGHKGYAIDRIGRGTIYAPVCCVSVFGGIQPSKLRAHLADGANGGVRDDGLLQRLQILVWPEVAKEWQLIDRMPNKQAQSRFASVFEKVVKLDPATPVCVHFDREAQELFYNCWSKLEARLRDGSLPESFVAHLSKYRSLMPSLSLLFMVADWTQTDGEIPAIGIEYARQAIEWCSYLESHARKVYAVLGRGGLAAAQVLAEKIRTGALPEVFSVREAYRPQWAGMTGPEEVEKAAAVLIDHDWLRREPEENKSVGGRPSKVYRVNPRVKRTKALSDS